MHVFAVLWRRPPTCRPLCRLVHHDALDPNRKPIEVKTVEVPDEHPDIPKERVFQQIRKPAHSEPIYTLDQASQPSDFKFMTKYHRYPALFNHISDVNYALRGVDNKDSMIRQFPGSTDFLMIGSGLVGSACSYYLKKKLSKAADILVIDKDPYNVHNSTAFCNGLLSSQSKSRDVARLAALSKELIRALRNDVLVTPEDYARIRYRPCTHLILWPEKDVSSVLKAIDLQIEDGNQIDAKLPSELETTYPWLKLENSEVFIGTHGNQDEALVDPLGLRAVYRTLAQAHGANFLQAEAIDFNTTHLIANEALDQLSNSAIVARNPATRELRSIGYANTLLSLGHNTPFLESKTEIDDHIKDQMNDLHFVQPRLRIQISFHSLSAPTINFPVITDTDGSILIKDDFAGDFKLCLTYEESELFNDFDVQLMDLDSEEPFKNYYHRGPVFENYFNEVIKPRLIKKIPSMEDAQFLVALSGYESYNTHDGCPILGEHPYHVRLGLSMGYGSRMMLYAPAVAAIFSELFIENEEKTLDLSPFYWNRVMRNRKIDEFDLLIR